MALQPTDYRDQNGEPFKTWEDYAAFKEVEVINERANWRKAENLAMAKADECKRLQRRIDNLQTSLLAFLWHWVKSFFKKKPCTNS